MLEQLATFLSSTSLQRDPGRKAAVTVNTAMALLSMLKVAGGETIAEHGDVKHPTIEKIVEEILRVRKQIHSSGVGTDGVIGLTARPRPLYSIDCL